MSHMSHRSVPHRDFSARSLFKRCVPCSESSPPCPSCSEGTTCILISQSCDACASTKCIPTAPSSSSGLPTSASSNSGASNAGAIAGGVVGGLAFIGIAVFLVWWFVVRKKRQQQQQYAPSEATSGPEVSDTFAANRTARQSTHSIASTVLTRASNVIQIAYIPGVTNRSPSDAPDALVPPVPPLPGASPDQHFFMPADLRDSAWSGTSAHRSMAPTLRSSVATTIYRSDAIVSPMPAQQVMRTRAAVVSIHQGSDNPSRSTQADGVNAPAVPEITEAQLAKAKATSALPPSSIVARTVVAKPVMVTRSGSKKKSPGASNTGASSTPNMQAVEEVSEPSDSAHGLSTFDHDSSDEDEGGDSSTRVSGAPSAAQRHSRNSGRLITEPPARGESPFADENEVK